MRYIIVFLGSVLIMASVGCRGIATPSATPRPTLPPTASATPPPSDTPTPFTPPPTVTARPSACEVAPRPTRLVIMERGVVVEDDVRETAELVNVRAGPGTTHPVVAQMDLGNVFLVVDGPECSPQYAWFQVQFRDVTGWIAEGDTEAYYVAPFLPQ